MARAAGVSDAMIQSIKEGNRPDFDDAEDVVAYDLAFELHRTHEVSDETYARAVTAFDEQGVAELINLCGFYTMVSMSLNTFRIGVPEGTELPFE